MVFTRLKKSLRVCNNYKSIRVVYTYFGDDFERIHITWTYIDESYFILGPCQSLLGIRLQYLDNINVIIYVQLPTRVNMYLFSLVFLTFSYFFMIFIFTKINYPLYLNSIFSVCGLTNWLIFYEKTKSVIFKI